MSFAHGIHSSYNRIGCQETPVTEMPIGSKTPIEMEFKERMLQARTEAKLSQGKLAKAAGIKRATVSHWENGTRGKNPGQQVMERVASVLKVNTTWLVSGIGPKHPSDGTLMLGTDMYPQRALAHAAMRGIISDEALRVVDCGVYPMGDRMSAEEWVELYLSAAKLLRATMVHKLASTA